MFGKTCILMLSCLGLKVFFASATPAPALAPEHIQVTKLPGNIPTCPEDNNINECIQNAFNVMLRNSINGVPELNIPPIDPLIQNKLNIQFSNNLIRGKAAVRNVQIAGLSKSTVRKMEYQRNGTQVKLNVHFQAPLIEIDGQYKAEVQLNNVKFASKGLFNITMIDIDSKSEHYAELYEREGRTYMRLTKLNLDPTLRDMKIYASGLVPEPALNDALLEIVNQNWRILYRSIVSSTRSTWEPIIVRATNEFFSHLPFDLLITNAKE